MQSAATLRGEINIRDVTFRFYVNIKDAQGRRQTRKRSQLLNLIFTSINGGETGQCSQQRDWDKMWMRSGINGILKRDSKRELFRFAAMK